MSHRAFCQDGLPVVVRDRGIKFFLPRRKNSARVVLKGHRLTAQKLIIVRYLLSYLLPNRFLDHVFAKAFGIIGDDKRRPPLLLF